jgi:hypothetical protein
LSFCPTFTLSGAYQRAGNDDTAFGGSRTAAYVFNAEAAAFDQPTYEADRTWVRNFWEAMRPHKRRDRSAECDGFARPLS